MNLTVARTCVFLGKALVVVGSLLVGLALFAWAALLPIGLGLYFSGTVPGSGGLLMVILGATFWIVVGILACMKGCELLCRNASKTVNQVTVAAVTDPTDTVVTIAPTEDPGRL
jgi:hypothetical protein